MLSNSGGLRDTIEMQLRKEPEHKTRGREAIQRNTPADPMACGPSSGDRPGFPTSPFLAVMFCVSGSPAPQLHQLFGPHCPSRRRLLDHRLNQEPVRIFPVPTLTCTWLIPSCQALRRARQDESQARSWSGVSYWPPIEVICCGHKTSCLALKCSRERQEGHLLGKMSRQAWLNLASPWLIRSQIHAQCSVAQGFVSN